MYPKAIVAFQSIGGSLVAGIDIGMQIRLRNYMTLVPSRVLCASACATAWLGGTTRLMGPGALIGFHAASIDQNGQAIETGVGNALLGAYLNKLGLPDRAIVFITQAHPNDLTRLTMADAARVGIDVSLFTTPSQPVARPMPQMPAGGAGGGGGLLQACAGDIKKDCQGIEKGQGRIIACIRSHVGTLSKTCQGALTRVAAIGKACGADIEQFCGNEKQEARGACIQQHKAEFSEACRQAMSGAAPAE
jgi:hypothetical protein